MSRMADSSKSKSDDEFGPRYPALGLKAQKLESDFSAPKPVTLSLADAMQLVVDGRMEPMEVFLQLPLPLVASLNEAARQIGGRDFSALSSEQQKMIFAALTEAVKNPPLATTPPPRPSPAIRRSPPAATAVAALPVVAAMGKKWWQFWRA